MHEAFSVWYILWLKRGRKRYIYTPYMPMYSVFIFADLYAYACITVVAFILQLFQVCVDVVCYVTTS